MSSLRIITYPDNYRVWKSLVAAQYNGVDIELPAFDWEKDLKSDAFKAKTLVGKVPILETPQGNIFESGAIARYIARLNDASNLLGSTNFQKAQVDQWIDFCLNEVEPARGIWLYPIQGYIAFNEKAHTEAKKELAASFAVLNTHLLSNTFLVGNAVTLADITIATALVHLFTLVLTSKFLAAYPNLVRWFTTLINQKEFSTVIGKVEFAKEEASAPKSAKAEKPKAEAKPAAAAAAPKPAAAAKPAEEEYDEDAIAPKKKNPLDDLPPSTMDMDTTKKLAFSARPFLPTFFEQMWPTFDAAGYSWFTAEYNYNSDNKEFWKLGNSLGGFMQRSDACRKYAMGTIQASGPVDEDSVGPWTINGVWLFRGTTMLAEMKEENPDSEYYTWTKVDTTTEAGKKKIKEYFFGEEVNGLKVLDRRFFK